MYHGNNICLAYFFFTKLLQLYCFILLYTFLNGLSLNFNHILSSNLNHQYLLCEFKSGIYDGDLSFAFFFLFFDFYHKFNFWFSFFLSFCHKVSKKVHILDCNRIELLKKLVCIFVNLT